MRMRMFDKTFPALAPARTTSPRALVEWFLESFLQSLYAARSSGVTSSSRAALRHDTRPFEECNMISNAKASQSQRFQELHKCVGPSDYTPQHSSFVLLTRLLKLRFFAPFDILSASQDHRDQGFNSYIEEGGALASFAETAAWRLGATRVMVRSGLQEGYMLKRRAEDASI